MAITPTTNYGSTYYNINQCRTFSMNLAATTLTCLSSVDIGGFGVGQPCSEVIIENKTGGIVTIYDNNNASGAHGFALDDNDSFTFRGLTNVNDVSAYAASGGAIYYRTQFFSSNPAR